MEPSPFNVEAFLAKIPKKRAPRHPEDLQSLADIPDFIHDPPEKLKQFLRKRLNFLRHICVDDLPVERIMMDDPRYDLYKCRSSWWIKVDQCFNQLQKVQKLSPRGLQAITEFKDLFQQINWNKFRTAAEIAIANHALDVATAELLQTEEKLPRAA